MIAQESFGDMMPVALETAWITLAVGSGVKWTGRFSLRRPFCTYRNNGGILKKVPFWLQFSHILEKAKNRHKIAFL